MAPESQKAPAETPERTQSTTPPDDVDLARLVAAWPKLQGAIRRAILALADPAAGELPDHIRAAVLALVETAQRPG